MSLRVELLLQDGTASGLSKTSIPKVVEVVTQGKQGPPGVAPPAEVVTLTDATGDGEFAVPASFAFLSADFSAACRFRAYRTPEGRTADAARLATEAYPGGRDLVYEVVIEGPWIDEESFVTYRGAGQANLFYAVDGPVTIALTIKEF